MRLALLLLVASSCAPPVSSPQPPRGCALGPVLAPAAGSAVANYPVQLELDAAGQAARVAALEAKAPGWKITVDALGYPTLLAYPVTNASDPDLHAHVVQMFAALHDDLGLGSASRVMHGAPGRWHVATDTTDENFVSVSDGYIAQPSLHIEFRVARVIPLPAGFTRIPIAEFYRRWDPTGSVAVELQQREEGHQCDPVHSASDCAGAGPRSWSECVQLTGQKPDSLQYNVVRTDAGYRWVVQLYLRMGCPPGRCALVSHIPICADAITGETLSPAVCGLEFGRSPI